MASILNKANISYLGMTKGSNITKGDLNDFVTVTKTANTVSYTPNSVVTYYVNIINDGATDFVIDNVRDNLGAYTFGTNNLVPLDYIPASAVIFIDGVSLPDVVVTEGNGITINGFTVPAGQTATVSYSAMVNEFAPLDRTEDNAEIRNIADVTGTSNAVYTADAVIYPDANANLVITKTADKDSVSSGDTITYTFIVQNLGSGNADADVNAVITDTFNPRLTGITVELNNAPFTDFTYTEDTGDFATNERAITIPAASYSRTDTGRVVIDPQQAVVSVTGTIV